MKNKVLILIIPALFIFSNVICQTDSLISSIRYSTKFPDGYENHTKKAVYEASKINNKELPGDLNSSKVFFIEINKDDFPLLVPSYKAINKKLIKGFEKYPFSFQAFPNEYINKGKQYFIEQSFKYRVLIYSKFSEFRDEENKKVFKQYFLITLEDMTTGQKYYNDGYDWHAKYIKKFVKKVVAQFGVTAKKE